MFGKVKGFVLSMAGKALKNRKTGFSLTEMLCTVLIMSIVATSAVTGMVSLANSYKRILRTSNAEELCNVLTTTMTGELRYAKYIASSGGSLDACYSPNHRLCKYELDSGRLMVQPLKKNTSGGYDLAGNKRDMIAPRTYTDGLEITHMEITFDRAANCFTVKFDIGDSQTAQIAKTEFEVQGLNAEIGKGV